MRIAVLSDIHGNLPALEAVVADVRRQGADLVVCLGDNLSGPLLPRETAQFLMGTDWLILAGNHERQILAFEKEGGGASDAYAHAQLTADEFSWLRRLPGSASISDGKVFLCHGTPRNDSEHFLETPCAGALRHASAVELRDRMGGIDAQLFACGHSHVPRSARLPSGHFLVNPGSVGLQAYYDDDREYYEVELGTPDAHYAIVERHGGWWRSTQFAVPYDTKQMAELARLRGRADWYNALVQGYVR